MSLNRTVAQSVERLSQGPGSRCKSTDMSSNSGRGIRGVEKSYQRHLLNIEISWLEN